MALSIRSTNVYVTQLSFEIIGESANSISSYEERSLGVFEAPPDKHEEPADLTKVGSHKERVGKYFMWHLRRQMSIGLFNYFLIFLVASPDFFLDIWWLVCGVFLISVIERKNLLDESKKWFDPFRVVFELVSAFGGIGLSLGFPSVSSHENFCLRDRH